MKQLSEPLLPDDRDARLRRACHHVQDAIHGGSIHPIDTPSALRAHALHLSLLRYLPTATLLLIVVTFFEPPLWAVRAAARGFPGLYSSDEYPSFQLPTLGPFAGCAIEVSLFAVLALDLVLCRASQGGPRFWSHRTQNARVLLLVGALTDALVSVGLAAAGRTPIWRAAPYLRAGLAVAHSAQLRTQLRIMATATPAFAGVALLLLLLLCFSGWLAVTLFGPNSAEGRQVFPNLLEAVWQLLILLTPANVSRARPARAARPPARRTATSPAAPTHRAPLPSFPT